MRKITSLAFLCLAGAAPAAAETVATTSQETVIPFMSSLRAIEWKAASNYSLYLRDSKGDWYLIHTSNRCTRLRASRAIGFQTSSGDQLDRHSAILVQGQRCPVASIVRSGEPPKKARSRAG